ncbi:MAG: RluA family pseudouridine synthase [Polyangiales bacterium]
MKAPPPPPPGCDPDSIVMQFSVAREHAGMRLDRFIQNRIPRLSRTRANRVVKTCAFRADGTPRRPSQRVKAGEVVWIVRPPMDEPKVPLYFGVIHDDGQVLVIDKPPGLPMHPTATYYKHTLSFLLLTEYPHRSPQFAHRLDRETSGLVICGWDRDAEIVLKKQFERRNVQKTYLAIVEGVMEEDEGMMVQSMAPVEEGLHIMMELREDGLKAQTHYVVRGRAESSTLVELHPRTGRQHQLRVHLAGIGHPIVGDKLYGPGGPETFLQAIGGDRSQELLERLGHPRQALHAHRLSIGHPAGHEVEYEAPLSADLVQLWENRQQGVMTPVSFESLEERL